MRRLWGLAGAFALSLAALSTAPGCSSGGAAVDFACTGACTCSSTTCTCAESGKCVLGPVTTLADGAVASAPGVPPSGVSYECASKNDCSLDCGVGCTSHCAGRSVCTGICGANCTSSCEGSSTCTLTTGDNGAVSCSGNSTCQVAVGAGTVVSCGGNSTCDIECPRGGCQASCTGSSSCIVHCGPDAPCPVSCNGQRATDCPAATTCSDVCGKDMMDSPNDAGTLPPT